MKYTPACRSIQINGKQHYFWRAVDQDGDLDDAGKLPAPPGVDPHGADTQAQQEQEQRWYCRNSLKYR
jgi:hypothetical protein